MVMNVYILQYVYSMCLLFFFKQKTAYEMRMSDWSSDVCSSDLRTATNEYRCRSTRLAARRNRRCADRRRRGTAAVVERCNCGRQRHLRIGRDRKSVE